MDKNDAFCCCNYKEVILMPVKIIPENRIAGTVVLKPLKDKCPCPCCECLLYYCCCPFFPFVPCCSIVFLIVILNQIQMVVNVVQMILIDAAVEFALNLIAVVVMIIELAVDYVLNLNLHVVVAVPAVGVIIQVHAL